MTLMQFIWMIIALLALWLYWIERREKIRWKERARYWEGQYKDIHNWSQTEFTAKEVERELFKDQGKSLIEQAFDGLSSPAESLPSVPAAAIPPESPGPTITPTRGGE